MENELTREESEAWVEKGKIAFEEFKKEVEGKQVGASLSVELAALIYTILQDAITKEPLLGMFRQTLNHLTSVCAYAGLKYAEKHKEK